MGRLVSAVCGKATATHLRSEHQPCPACGAPFTLICYVVICYMLAGVPFTLICYVVIFYMLAGVPFILKCGKATNERKAEIRVQFTHPENGLFPVAPSPGTAHTHSHNQLGVGQHTTTTAALAADGGVHNNELVIRIQPDEAVYLKMYSKVPGMEFAPAETELNLTYKSRYPSRPAPEAYARLILDVIRGDQSQFVRSDELAAAWEIFTPLLHALEIAPVVPNTYPYGSRGPPQSDRLIRKHGYVYEGKYAGEWRSLEDPGKGTAALTAIRDEFALPAPRLAAIKAAFLKEMAAGLAGAPGATIKMIPSYVTDLPSGNETGAFWAIDVGGSNLRVLEVKLEGAHHMSRGRETKVTIPIETMQGPGPALFDFIADTVKAAGAPPGVAVGFTFSFPVEQTAVDAGRLIEWTKGFSASGCVGQEILTLLREACVRRGVDVRLEALVNDTVGTLVMRAYSDPAAKIGVILGTGTNACYGEYGVVVGWAAVMYVMLVVVIRRRIIYPTCIFLFPSNHHYIIHYLLCPHVHACDCVIVVQWSPSPPSPSGTAPSPRRAPRC